MSFESASEIQLSQLQFWATFFPDFGGIFVREGKNSPIEAVIKAEILLSLYEESDLPALKTLVGNICVLADRLSEETPV